MTAIRKHLRTQHQHEASELTPPRERLSMTGR